MTWRSLPTSEWTPNAVMVGAPSGSLVGGRDDAGAAGAGDEVVDLLEGSDGGTLAGRGHEFGGGRDLGPHRPRREVHRAQLAGLDAVHAGLRRRAPAGVHAIDVVRHHEEVGAELPGEEAA